MKNKYFVTGLRKLGKLIKTITFQLIPGIPLGLAFEVQHPRPFCIYVTHGRLFVMAIDEQHLLVCWLGLEVLNLLSSFVKLCLNVGERRGPNRAQ